MKIVVYRPGKFMRGIFSFLFKVKADKVNE